MALALCNDQSHRTVASRLYAISWPASFIYPRVHLVKAESRHQAQLSGTTGLYRTLLAMGIDGL